MYMLRNAGMSECTFVEDIEENMPTRYTSIFSCYGGKSRLAHLYPAPHYDTIIEPFAGAASYAARYADRKVILCEVNPRVAGIWKFLLSRDVDFWIEMIPNSVRAGEKADELFPYAPYGLIELMRAECNFGTMAATGVHNQITKLAADNWKRLKPRLRYWLPLIKHWQLWKFAYNYELGDYRNLPDIEATWFIDPPYNNAAGSRYAYRDINYQELADWCRSRRGQTIVCENEGATWLPFRPLARRRGITGRYQKSRAMEVYWENTPQTRCDGCGCWTIGLDVVCQECQQRLQQGLPTSV